MVSHVSGRLTLAFLGDVMIGRLVNRALRWRRPHEVWGDTLPVLLATDARFANLECVLSDRGEPWPGKRFVFRSDRRNLAVLQAARLTAVSLANNHILDFGEAALADTLGALDEAGIAHAGAGLTLAEASRPATVVVGPLRCAFIAATDNEPEWAAGPGSPGIFYVPCDPTDARFVSLLEGVRQAAEDHDLVIVSYHWGPNWGERPLPEHVAAGRALLAAGARVVYGHSPHVTRGVEFGGDGVILYSCGDFVDDYAVDEVERNDESFIFLVELEGTMVRAVRLVPTVITEFRARRPDPLRGSRICERMLRLCAELGTSAVFTAEGLLLQR